MTTNASPFDLTPPTTEQRRAILCDNVADLYSIDLSRLQAAA